MLFFFRERPFYNCGAAYATTKNNQKRFSNDFQRFYTIFHDFWELFRKPLFFQSCYPVHQCAYDIILLLYHLVKLLNSTYIECVYVIFVKCMKIINLCSMSKAYVATTVFQRFPRFSNDFQTISNDFQRFSTIFGNFSENPYFSKAAILFINVLMISFCFCIIL